MGHPLPPEKLAMAMERVRAWTADPDVALACPVCAAPGLEIADRSARPYAEWYALTCASCGLDATIAIPMAPPSTL